MKQILLLFILFLKCQFLISQTFEVRSIKNSGDIDKRINLVIISDGYQADELTKFETDANNFTNAMFSQSPFTEYADYFNVYIIKVISNESGATHPGTASDEPTGSSAVPITVVDNYFDTAFDSFNSHRLLYTSNNAAIVNVLANNFPQYDQALILVNSPYYGGSGGSFPIASTDVNSTEIAIHELGHTFVNLKDEYYPGDALAAEAINMTQQTDPNLVKWKNWINTNGIGIYQYGSGSASQWFRPHQNCKMRYLGKPFCAVCKEGIVEKIHDLISPIESFSPTVTTLADPDFPLDFNLNLIQTQPNTLETLWTLNDSEFDTNVTTVTLLKNDLIIGNNTLTSVVVDATPLLRIDNHETIHISTVIWTIENSTLGIGTIESTFNDIKIELFPNPTNAFVNVKIDSKLPEIFKIKMFSSDGKLLNSNSITNSNSTKIDISKFSQGIYWVHIFQYDVVIAKKKIIKN